MILKTKGAFIILSNNHYSISWKRGHSTILRWFKITLQSSEAIIIRSSLEADRNQLEQEAHAIIILKLALTLEALVWDEVASKLANIRLIYD